MMILKNAKIVLEDRTIEPGWMEIDGKVIKAIGEGETKQEGIDVHGNWVLPGFIDPHVHGGYGVDFETNGDVASFVKFAQNVPAEGITKYCQGSLTNSVDNLIKLYTNFGQFMSEANQGPQAICLGAHMEGPFIAPAKKGAHDPKLLMLPDIELTKKLNEVSGGNLAIVTYAPELQDGSYTEFLLASGILPSAGHSDITAEAFEREFEIGTRHVTHLFNAMSGFDHHRPGLAVAAFNHSEILCEVITDGIHVEKELLETIYKDVKPQSICIVTDAMNAKGLPDGLYKLGPLDVRKEGMVVRLVNGGNLAAAAATYDHNVRTFKAISHCTMQELILMTSINIAKQLGIFDKTGSLEVGKLGDVVVLNDKLEVQKTFCEGALAFDAQNH